MYKLKIGIIGAGNIAEEHLKVLKSIDDFSIFGIVSRTQKKAKNLARNFELKKVFNSIDHMMKSGQLDGVLILVSSDASYQISDSSNFYKHIRWEPKVTFNESIKKLLEYFKKDKK